MDVFDRDGKPTRGAKGQALQGRQKLVEV
jgi:hypothetical protein